MVDSEALLKELLETFRIEAQDHLGAMTALLVSLEHEAEPAERKRLVESIFRRMHTLKGAAHAVNLPEIAKTCQELEDLLASLKRGELELDAPLFDRLHDDIDLLSERVLGGADQAAAGIVRGMAEIYPDAVAAPAPAPPAPEPTPAPAADPARGPQNQGEPPLKGGGTEPVEHREGERRHPHAESYGSGETVRVSTRLLESLLIQAEELVSAKLTASALADELSGLSDELNGRGAALSGVLELARDSLRAGQVDAQTAKLASQLQQVCEAQLKSDQRLRSLEKLSLKHLRGLGGMVDPLLNDVKKLHLLPFSSLTDPFGKLVRDLGRELGKDAELSCSGCGIEVDRRILAELKEPLIHLVRNVMDHGIERPEERESQGKPARGRIAVEVRLQDANLAEVVISDDGRGIDLSLVKGAALRQELVPPEVLEAMSESEALQLVFESGISTSPLITTLSGRGVGLAIVREALEKLGGHVTVSSGSGRGTVFRLRLPLSFAMMRALLVETGGRSCFIPAANVELATRLPLEEIRSVEGRDTVVIGGEVISLVPLSRLLELGAAAPETDGVQSLVLLNAAEKRIAFAVDRVVEVQEILVKPLGRQLSRVRNVAGATVLGSGRTVPVLNIGDLFRSALLAAGAGAQAAQAAAAPKKRRVAVLVVEDSITSRTLLKNVLEASGFLVQTAIDGVDALSQLKTASFDIVVSDVEMPRMDGFQLTAAIRAESRWENLPVILVTGLESRADRERGIDVGANAYVVKSSFDQGSLVEVINKLT